MASVLVNQVPYDFQSLEFEVIARGASGQAISFGIVTGLEEIEYTASFNREKIYGTSRIPQLRTLGDVEFDGSMTLQRYWFDYIMDQVRSIGVPIGQLEMTMALSYFREFAEIRTDTLVGAAFAEIGNSASRGPDPVTVSLPLDLMNIFWDGEDALGNRIS